MESNVKITEIEKRLQKLREEKEKLLHEASEIEGAYLSTYEMRPAGRHVLTIGEDLIQDPIAAILELVKNSYDADSPDVIISIQMDTETDCLEIQVEDHGHGMSPKDVINKWLVPSTKDKKDTRISPLGRIMQGRKGIGRYAASILGDSFHLKTVDSSGIETLLSLSWSHFAEFEYLDQIQIPIETRKTSQQPGTSLAMRSALSKDDYWDKKHYEALRFELRKMISPVVDGTFDPNFEIKLSLKGYFYEKGKLEEIIKPYPIQEFFDYRINGEVTSEGHVRLSFDNQLIKNSPSETIVEEWGMTGCGNLSFDIRVYDRDPSAIEKLIARGLQHSDGSYFSKQQARQLLNAVNGIGVYRNGFRIRPLGDSAYDWLQLNKKRIQNPTRHIGSNQVIGYVHIESEEASGLEEKSARDGLKDNTAYAYLKQITDRVIGALETRRYSIRRKLGLIAPAKKIETQLEGLYDYGPLKKSVDSILKKANLPQNVISKVNEIITNEEIKKNETIEEIKKAVAIYQGQATLGKIINVILHEGRRPLNYFKNQIPNLHFYGNRFTQKREEECAAEIVRLTTGIADNASIFVNLFGRLDPLAAKKRETKSGIILHDAINGAVSVFEKELERQDIDMVVHCPKDIHIIGWQQDIYTIFVNLIDNSIYWIVEKNPDVRKIEIEVQKTGGGFCIDYTDSGPGISAELLESGIIFEPEFTTKLHGGTGLGLSIAGEAATRNGLRLTAVEYDKGAHFILEKNEEGENNV